MLLSSSDGADVANNEIPGNLDALVKEHLSSAVRPLLAASHMSPTCVSGDMNISCDIIGRAP